MNLKHFPTAWPLRRLKFLADVNMGQSPDSSQVSEYRDESDFPFLQGNAEFGVLNPVPKNACANPPKRATEGDILLSVRAPVGSMNIADRVYGIGRGLCAIRTTQIASRYAWWSLHHFRGRLMEVATGSTYEAVTAEEVRNLSIAVPEKNVQRRIADYLDTETAEIDALIAEKERMLALLEEKRAAVITHAVTRGLDPHAPLKTSGLEWLEEIPEHWPITRFKYFARIGNGSTPNRDNPEYWEDGEYPWLNSSVVGDRTVHEASRFVTETALEECHLPRIESPALLVAITGQGKTRGRSTVLNFEATINQHLAYVKSKEGAADSLYLSYLLDTAYTFIRSDSDGAGSTRGAITCEQLGNFRVPLPPLLEQQAILEAIRTRTKRYDLLEQSASDSIRLLKERRSALITAAVTGQISIEEMRV